MPPRDTLVNYLPKALAIDLAIDVLPTPGGPCRQIMLPFEFPFLNFTAKNSRILSLTYFSPVWSSLSIFSARLMSLISSDDSFHGISSKVSMYFIETADWDSLPILFISFYIYSLTWGGRFLELIFYSRSDVSDFPIFPPIPNVIPPFVTWDHGFLTVLDMSFLTFSSISTMDFTFSVLFLRCKRRV